MAISLGKFRRHEAQQKAMKDLADKVEAERRKESKLGGVMGLLSPLAGLASKGLMAALGVGSAGLLSPLLAGASTSLFKKWGEEGLRSSGWGGKEGKIVAEGEFGYGKKAAAEHRKLMREGRKDRGFGKESLLTDIGLSYISALTPTIDPKTGEITSTELGKNIGGKGKFSWFDRQETGLFGTGKDAAKSVAKSVIPSVKPNPVITQSPNPNNLAILPDELKQGYGITGMTSTDSTLDEILANYQEGGQVPGEAPSISDYFGMQGKTLGGSDKKSFAEMLGRK